MTNEEILKLRAELQGSFILFCQYFYEILNQRNFILSRPLSRESHFITCSKALTKCARLESMRLILNLPPGHGKSTMLTMWVAWTMSMYPDSQYMYISYSKKIATKQTEIIKRIISLYEYQLIFGIRIQHDSKAKEYFKNNYGGTVAAFGAAGSITGFDAGLPGLDRFTGALIVDDAHKPDEVHSDTIREKVIQNYKETTSQRIRGIKVPIIFLGQRLHEADLPAYLLDSSDGNHWDNVILKSLDEADNALYPEAFSKEHLLKLKEFSPYVFASQHQQNPIPAGGALFKPDYFVLLDEEPEILMTFITADTAETDKKYNDATVFSFWGLYKLRDADVEQYALHWIDCAELRVEPKDLKSEFMDFWARCSRYKVQPRIAAIEKKSSGSTLISLLREVRGLEVRNIDRTDKKSKTHRFLDAQPHVYQKLVSFPSDADHVDMCITHMSKITANNSHRWDDIADTLADAVRIALIDKTIYFEKQNESTQKINDIINNDLYKRINLIKSTNVSQFRVNNNNNFRR
jgi:predicted phage terminase large subunit-like protein